MAIICKQCGAENAESAKSCIRCGQSLTLPGTRKLILLDNRYEVLNLVKSGAMGCVYRALDTRLNNIVALKKKTSSLQDPVEIKYAEERFLEEARILSKLHHGGLPKVSDFFIMHEPDSTAPGHYLVMTFIEGKDLETIMDERKGAPFSPDTVLDYFQQILTILDYLHTQSPSIIYRDINPRNIMIQNGKVFLVDFGIARIFTPQKKGTTIGTPGYAAPEQYKGFAEPRSDLYGLGVLIHYLLTGINPEESSTDIFSFKPPRSLNPGVPEYLDAAVMRLLELVPESRPSSAKEVITLLKSQSVQPYVQPYVLKGSPQPAKKAAGKGPEAILQGIGKFYSQIPRHLIKLALCLAAACLIFAAVMLVLKPGSVSRPAPLQSESLPEADISSLIASIKDGSIVKVKSIVERNPRLVNETDQNNGAALHCAVASGKVEIAGYLVEKGADVNAKDYKGNTPLLLTCREGNLEMAELLVEKGADISGRDYEFGSTALHWASYKGHIEVAEMLLSKGAEVKGKNRKGRTPLHWAADGNREKLAALLMEKGAKVDSPDNEGVTPLHMAVQGGYVAIVKLLIEKGARVNQKDKKGLTPLCYAARENQADTAKMLLHRGALKNIDTNEGLTAYSIAKCAGYNDLAKMLLDHTVEIRPLKAYLLWSHYCQDHDIRYCGVPLSDEEWKKIKFIDRCYLTDRPGNSGSRRYVNQLFCFSNEGKMLFTWTGYVRQGDDATIRIEDRKDLNINFQLKDKVVSPTSCSWEIDGSCQSTIYVFISGNYSNSTVYTDNVTCRLLK